jgi:branched-chain amino acid transport system substrate-binding protein
MMRRTLVSIAVAAGIAMLGATAAQAQSKISGDTVKIGVLTDMSGLYSELGGAGSVAAAQMAIDDFKAQAKPTFKIEMVSADHQNKADIGAQKAREWFDTQGVDMVNDVLNSAVAIAVAKVANEKKKVYINNGAASTRLTNEDCTPYTIHYAYDTYALANGTGKAVVQNGGKTWFFLTADYAFGASLEKDTSDVVKANGGQILGTAKHPLSTADFSSYLLQAQASKAQIIGLANAGGDTINAIKAANEFGITKNQSLAGLLVFITDIHSLGLPIAQGMMLTTGFYWDMDDGTRKFAAEFEKKMKKKPSMIQAGVYSSTMQYLNAVKTTGTDDADAVMAQLKKTKIDDFFGKGGYIRADGRMVHDMYLAQVKTPAESKGAWDYYKIVKTIPAEEAFQPLSKSACSFVKK